MISCFFSATDKFKHLLVRIRTAITGVNFLLELNQSIYWFDLKDEVSFVIIKTMNLFLLNV